MCPAFRAVFCLDGFCFQQLDVHASLCCYALVLLLALGLSVMSETQFAAAYFLNFIFHFSELLVC